MKYFIHVMIILLFSISACKQENNSVLAYLDNAEVQYETEEQKENILEALNDILTLPVEKLKKKRYKDYQGTLGVWNLPTLIYRYFVPDARAKTMGDNFYEEIKSDKVQQRIRAFIKKIEQTGT